MRDDTVQIVALAVMMILAAAGYRRLRDAGAAAIPDERAPPPPHPVPRPDGDDAAGKGDHGGKREG
jgi:hypothetical protein